MPTDISTDSLANGAASFQPSAFDPLPVEPTLERRSETPKHSAEMFILPGGYVDDAGVAHTAGELEPLTGHDEEFLAALGMRGSAAGVVTSLLSRRIKRIGTIGAVTPALVRELLVGDRDFLMMQLRALSFGSKVTATELCPNPACAEPMDLVFRLEEIPIERKAIATRFFEFQLSLAALLSDDGDEQRRVEFRMPTGGDQEDLAAIFAVDEAHALDLLLARCVKRIGTREGCDAEFIARLPPATRGEIEAEIERLSPKVSPVLDGVCPACGLPFETPFDLTTFFAAELRRNLPRLEHDVHTLALHYHWSEQDILALPRTKRLRYIRLLQAELAQPQQM